MVMWVSEQVWEHPSAERLFCEEVEVGEEVRAAFITPSHAISSSQSVREEVFGGG